jgi:ABC-type ATPase with predicted acetyltransferase domain
MSNCFWYCEECGHIMDGLDHKVKCEKCASPRVSFDSELEARDHIEVWPIDEEHAIVIETEGEDGDAGPTMQ